MFVEKNKEIIFVLRRSTMLNVITSILRISKVLDRYGLNPKNLFRSNSEISVY